METYGELIKSVRLKAGLLQTELAPILGITQGYLSKVESGKQQIELSAWLKFCAVSGVNPLIFTESRSNKELRKAWRGTTWNEK